MCSLQRKCIEFALKVKPQRRYIPRVRFQYKIWWFVTSRGFEYGIFILIIINTLTLAMKVRLFLSIRDAVVRRRLNSWANIYVARWSEETNKQTDVTKTNASPLFWWHLFVRLLPPPRRGYAISAACLSVIHSVTERDYCRKPILLKLGVVTGLGLPIERTG